jgi:hypothetical protein
MFFLLYQNILHTHIDTFYFILILYSLCIQMFNHNFNKRRQVFPNTIEVSLVSIKLKNIIFRQLIYMKRSMQYLETEIFLYPHTSNLKVFLYDKKLVYSEEEKSRSLLLLFFLIFTRFIPLVLV